MDLAVMERRAVMLSPSLTDTDLAYLPASVRDSLARSSALGRLGPRAAFGPFRQMLDGSIMLANQTAITGTTEAAMFSVAQYAGFAANQLRAGQIWHLTAFGIMTTSTTPGNITITPRFGTSTSGTSLGASTATALIASQTNIPWRLEYDLIVRSVGNAGANSNVVGNGVFTAGVAVVANDMVMGSTANVAVDTSIASGLFIGVTLGAATVSMTAMGVMLESLN